MSRIQASYGQELKTSWFLPLRLAIFLVVFGVFMITQETRADIHPSFFVYSLLTLILLFSLMIRLPEKLPRLARAVIMLQIFSEAVVEAVVINVTGLAGSPFTALFLLTIISAALAYRLLGTLFTATIVSFLYSLVVISGSGQDLTRKLDLQALRDVYTANDQLFYTVFIYVCIFYLVAFVAGYLSQNIKFKEAELAAASESLKRVRLETDEILKHLHSGLITIDHFGRIIYFNQAAEKITGFQEGKIKGQNCLEVFAERMPEFSAKLLSVIKANTHEQRCEVTITDANGKEIPIGISTSLLETESSGIRGVIGIFQDLTEAKKFEEKMRDADRLAAVGELSASIAHEIRNPLASISGSVQILKQELELEGENQRLMNLIIKEASRLSNILNDFLTYARVKEPNFGKVELNRLISDVVEIARTHPSHAENTKLSVDADDTTIYVSGDEEQIKQVLINLVVNAQEAVDPSSGKIAIEVDSSPFGQADQIKIVISDNGPGIQHGAGDKIFTPFFSTKKEGTGLGLAIVKRLVENMGGCILFESSSHGGTIFTIMLIKYIEGANLTRHKISEEGADLPAMTTQVL